MNFRVLFSTGTMIVMAAWLTSAEGLGLSSVAHGQVGLPGKQVAPGEDDGIEILTQGPVHEAFAQPGTSRLGATTIVRKKPPELIEELPPDQRPDGDNVVWISGYWGWDVDRDDFVWVSGLWRREPAGKDWVPGYWDGEGDGFRWVSGYWAAEGQVEIELLPTPPAAVVEALPPQTVADASYSPGGWVFREQRYLWRPGFWVPHRPGWIWNHATYVYTPGGYVFVDAHWDYDYQRRGLLFAPAYFQPRFFAGGNRHIYRPYYAVNTDLLLASLFVRPAVNHYVFGDYFAPRYSQLGFTPWVDYRIGGRWNDSAWDYYRWNHRANPTWETNLRGRYVDLRTNNVGRPPRTFAEQQRVLGGKNVQTTALVSSINNIQVTNIKLRTVSKTEVQHFQKTVAATQVLRQQRIKVEDQVRVKGIDTGKRGAVAVQLPRVASGANKRAVDPTAPPAPTLPKFQPKPPAGAKVVDDDDRPDPRPGKKVDAPKKGPPKIIIPTPTKSKVTIPKTTEPAPKAEPKPRPPEKIDPPAPKAEPKPRPQEKKATPKAEPKSRPPERDDPPAPKAEPKPRPQEKKATPPPKKAERPPERDDPPAPKAEPKQRPQEKKAAPPKKEKGKDDLQTQASGNHDEVAMGTRMIDPRLDRLNWKHRQSLTVAVF